jgi:hypothetical protein
MVLREIFLRRKEVTNIIKKGEDKIMEVIIWGSSSNVAIYNVYDVEMYI